MKSQRERIRERRLRKGAVGQRIGRKARQHGLFLRVVKGGANHPAWTVPIRHHDVLSNHGLWTVAEAL